MFLAHSFRLRDPWQCECTPEGATRWSRVFHRPTGLETDDALWLVCSGLPPGAVVTFNGARLPCATRRGECETTEELSPRHTGDTPVPPVNPHQYDVTAQLIDANRIEIEIPSDLQPPASSLQPDHAFPYDIRLGVVGCS